MGLDIPTLDDRTFEALLEDARKRIPVYAPEWTDHNAADPGITVLELLAWLAETYIYQLDQVTDEHVQKYLQLMGVAPAPPSSAEASLTLSVPDAVAGWTIPAGAPLTVDDGTGSPLQFETTAPVRTTAARVRQVISDHRAGRIDNTTANLAEETSFLAFGPTAGAGSTMYAGFDQDPFDAPTLDLMVDYDDEGLPAPGSHGSDAITFEPSVELRWEHCTNYDDWHDPASWAPVSVRRDETSAFYQRGVVTLERPPDWTGEAGSILDHDGAFRWLRCTVVHPEPDDAGYEVPPRLKRLSTNVVAATHRSHITNEQLLTPDGRAVTTDLPNQKFHFAHAPVLEATVTVGSTEWTAVPDFDASGPDDRQYVLDHERGMVRFGNGRRGRVPDSGQSVEAMYAYGGGTVGNGHESSRWRFAPGARLGDGIYTYFCEPHREAGMRGAIVVGRDDDDPNFGDWFDNVPNYAGIEDWRTRSEVTIAVGVDVDGDPVGFSPPAVRIDPGTLVRFSWHSPGHNIVVAEQPPESEWLGHPVIEDTGFEITHEFAGGSLDEVTVVPRTAATGGREGESVADALSRLERDLQTPYRAVTSDDYEYVAQNTPELRVGRAAAVVDEAAADGPPAADDRSIAGRTSETDGTPAAGHGLATDGVPRSADCEAVCSVVVYVIPYAPSSRPTPSNGFLEAVRCHLERHRLLTDQVSVAKPTYVDVSVSADIVIKSGYAESSRIQAVEAALTDFLDPLKGFDGDGWPFGRTLYKSELHAVIDNVDGVDCALAVSATPQGDAEVKPNGDVTIGAPCLFAPGDHTIVVRDDDEQCGGGV